MSDDERTVPLSVGRVGVRTLTATVTEGPDAGRAATARAEGLTIGTADGNDLVLTDPTVSRFHLALTRRADGVLLVDLGSTNGTTSGGVRVERGVLGSNALVRLGRTTVRLGDGAGGDVELLAGDALAGLRGRSAIMRRLMAQVRRAAASDASVLVTGESGTGKELVARALHELGPRRAAPFVTVDCGALAPSLVASELFGHEKGAFTGADRQHAGAFEQAHGGTLFLDEVGELPAALQAALLGVLERRRFRRLGGRAELATDVRVVAATHRELRGEVNAGAFRLDLYYRLAVVVLDLPPLRERPDDVPLLVEHFLRECGHDGPVDELVSPEAVRALQAQRWPGNVRELRNLVEATVAMGELPSARAAVGAAAGASEPDGSVRIGAALLALPYKQARAALLARFEAEYLAALLARCEGNVSRAAREAGLHRSHVTSLVQRHQIK
jgi:DNA-binding NtrC family response regulator